MQHCSTSTKTDELKVLYIRPNITVEEIWPGGPAEYNYKGVSFYLFKDFDTATKWANGEIGDDAIIATSDNQFEKDDVKKIEKLP